MLAYAARRGISVVAGTTEAPPFADRCFDSALTETVEIEPLASGRGEGAFVAVRAVRPAA